MDQKRYDYAFVGAGAAGLQLILKMISDPFFKEKEILILEKDTKSSNDRTWCFWEQGETIWDQLVAHTWENGLFINSKETLLFKLNPYKYKMVRSADFYVYARKEISKAKRATWISDKIIEINGQTLHGEKESYLANHIFDSRIPAEFEKKQNQYHSLIQHFKGWFIRTDKPIFDPTSFTMMDYRLKWKNSTSFTYLLPVSAHSALVEFTLFNDQLLLDHEYDNYLRKYLKHYLRLTDYEIEEVEQGSIPMSDYPFHQHHEKHVTKIGTAGGWVRPSSGYSFKNADRYSSMVINNIKSGRKPGKAVATSRFRRYDSIFLSVLSSRNDLGEDIFTQLYTKRDIHSVFRFLDEASSILEDIKVMFSLNRPQFWKAFFFTFFK